MRYRKTEDTMYLLGGALLGAAAMYLLDPEMGRKRRAYVRDHAGDYLESAGDALQSGWEHAREAARGMGHTIAAKAGDYGDKLSDMAHDYSERLSGAAHEAGSSWGDRMKDAGSSLSDTWEDWKSRGRKMIGRYTGKAQDYADDYSGRASDVTDNVTEYGNRLWKQVRGLGGKLGSRARDAAQDAREAAGEHSTPVLPITVTAIGCCAIGVGMMYLMDPRLGRSRRAWLADKATSLFRRTGKSFYRTGRDLANRTQGYAYETASRFSSAPITSEQLRDRIHSEMGRIIAEPRLVQVMTDSNGLVTLTGSCMSSETDRLVSMIESIPGVKLVINRMETRGAESSGQGKDQRVPQM